MQLPAKFNDVPVEPDTRITSQTIVNAGDFDALHQKWTWEGIRAESLIFVAGEVGDLDDAEIEGLVRRSGLAKLDSQFTLKRDSHGFTFVNFNFES
jgi:hypothetical protein